MYVRIAVTMVPNYYMPVPTFIVRKELEFTGRTCTAILFKLFFCFFFVAVHMIHVHVC